MEEKKGKWIRNAFGDVIGFEQTIVMTVEEAKERFPEHKKEIDNASPQPHREEANFIQVGQQLECGHCNPKYEIPDFKGFVCSCKCHREDIKEKWGEKLEELINDIRSNSSTDSVHIHKYVRSLLSQHNEKLVEKMAQEMLKNLNYPAIFALKTQDYTEGYIKGQHNVWDTAISIVKESICQVEN